MKYVIIMLALSMPVFGQVEIYKKDNVSVTIDTKNVVRVKDRVLFKGRITHSKEDFIETLFLADCSRHLYVELVDVGHQNGEDYMTQAESSDAKQSMPDSLLFRSIDAVCKATDRAPLLAPGKSTSGNE